MTVGFGSGSSPPGSATLLMLTNVMLTILTKDSSIFDFNYLEYIYSGNHPTPDDSNDTQESNLHSGKLRLAYFFFVNSKNSKSYLHNAEIFKPLVNEFFHL